MYRNLYIGDSSEDERKEEEQFALSSVPVKRFAVSSYLLHKGQKLLDSVRNEYKKKKGEVRSKLQEEFKEQAPILDIEVDKNLLGDYLLHKSKKTNNDFTTAFDSELFEKLRPEASRERDMFQQTFDAFSERVVHVFYEYLTNQRFDTTIWRILSIEVGNESEFLANVLSGEFFLITKASKVKKLDFAKLILKNEDLQNLKQFFVKEKYSKYADYKFRDFLFEVINGYLTKTYLEQSNNPILQIYEDFQQLLETEQLSADLVPFLPFHRKWFGTSLEDTYVEFIKANNQRSLESSRSSFLIELINFKNSEINFELIKHRPTDTFAEGESFAEHLVKFLIEHRILRSKIKEQGIKGEYYEVTYNKALPLDQASATLKITANGAKTDLRHLGLEQHNYRVITKKIQNIHFIDSMFPAGNVITTAGEEIRKCFIAIINGVGRSYFADKEASGFPISYDNQAYLYKLADLLFNLETERNISSFITTPMFFDLVADSSSGYRIEDLPSKLPMAIEDAVDISRYASENYHLPRRYKFDYKKSDFGISDFIEFDIRNCRLLFDWAVSKGSVVRSEELQKCMDQLQEASSIIIDTRCLTPRGGGKRRKSTENVKKLQESSSKMEVKEQSNFEIIPQELLAKANSSTSGLRGKKANESRAEKKSAKEEITHIIDIVYEIFSRILNLEGLDEAISQMTMEWYGIDILTHQMDHDSLVSVMGAEQSLEVTTMENLSLSP